MELLNTCLVNGDGICFQSKQEYEELFSACQQLGYYWHWSTPSFVTYAENRFVRLRNGYLFWANIRNDLYDYGFKFYDWSSIKAGCVNDTKLDFVY